MNLHLEGKVALVTGAASGIGRACAVAFAREGAHVVVSDLETMAEGGAETVRLVEAAGGKARWIPCDVADHDQIRRLMEETVAAFGRLDVAVNNAGIEGAQAPAADHPDDNWDRVLRINLEGAWQCMKHELPHLLARRADGTRGGAIVNVSSIAGLLGFPNIGPYVASKHGMIGITRTVALEYAAEGVRANVVCPAAIQTPMIDRFVHRDAEASRQLAEAHPIGRFGTPEEVAAAVLWLASDAASFVTGHALAVDGGYTIR
jgi:NAD(P)-dependent dehydrogenase (short-subunit alcohol dehydrogenase family)